jgi:hypothetical protein
MKLLDDVCVACGAMPAPQHDRLGLQWCATCKHRGLLVNRGAEAGYRHLRASHTAILPGPRYWCLAATFWPDTAIVEALELMGEEIAS